MIKKIFCLLCCIVAFALSSWAGGTDYYYKVTATAQPTGAGKVYVASTKEAAPADGDEKWKTEASTTDKKNSSQQAASKEFWLYAKPAEGYVLVNWTKADGSVQGTNKIQSTGVLSSSKENESNPEAYTFTAHFAKAGAVVVESADELLGGASIDKPSNAVGDQVTLTATADMFAGRFTGWTTPSGTVVKDSPYTFTVTEANKGTYIANYEKTDVSTTGIYCYVHNVAHSRSLGLMGISDKTVSSDEQHRKLKNSIMLLEDGSDIMRSSPAFVLKLTGKTDGSGGLTDANLEAQGMGSKDISGQTFSFTNQGDHFYITGSAGSLNAYMVDYADAPTQEEHFGKVHHPGLYNGANENDKQYHWVVTPITELSKDFCFGAMPSPKTKDEAGKYYTTMYTKFPYRCLDGVKAYVVSSVDTKAHKVVLTLIESGEVPSGTPVVLECASTKPADNRLLPLVEEPAAIAEKKLLKGEIWLKDENKTEGEYRTKFDSKTMLVLSNDELAFKNVNNTDVLAGGTATGTLTYIANNTCYLQVSSEMTEATTFTIEKASSVVTKETTLAGLSQEAADGVTPYKLTGDDLECVGAIASDSYNYLVVKDGGYSTQKTSNKQGYREYLIRSSYNGGKENTTRQTAYDQSNWILVDLSGIADAQVDNYRNCKIASITGTYREENPRFVATQIVLGDKTAPYAPNHYIATNFMTTYSADGTGNGVEDAAGNTYYFMNPKDGEWAIVAWAVWDKATHAFYVPAKDDEGTNAHGFAGGFKVDLRYNEGDITTVKMLDEQSDKGQNVYTFPALIVKKTATSASAPRRAAITPDTRELSTTYTVYPLSLSAGSVVTGVSTVDQAKTVCSVVYYNLQGMASPTPHAGLNVVVTRYTDGSTQVAKVMRP